MNQTVSAFSFFYKYSGRGLFLAVMLSFVVGLLDGLGLSMFLPLLQVVSGGTVQDTELGQLGFIIRFLEGSGWRLTIGSLLLLMSSFFVLKGCIAFIQYFYRVKLQEQFAKRVRLETLTLLNEISYKAFLTTSSGRIQNTLTAEVDRVSKAFQSYFLGVQAGVMVLVYLLFALMVNPQFALLVSVGGGLTNIIYKRIYVATKGTSRGLSTTTDQLQDLVIQHVGNFKYLKATGMVDRFARKLREVVGVIERANVRIGLLMSILISAREPLVIGVVALVIYVQVSWLGTAIGPILVSLLFFYRALSFLMQLQTHSNHYLSVSGSLSNVNEFQEHLRQNKEVIGTGHIPVFKSHLSIRDGNLSYGSTKALESLTLTIHKHEIVAFVGESGSGKTSLINVLAGLYPLDSGDYFIDETDILKIDKPAFQRKIGYITQDPVIFNDTVYNNVTFWAEQTTENVDRYSACLRQSAAFEFVQTLEGKDQHMLNTGGANLSGGQRQRIAIARELFKSVDLLIFDEATSALDSVTEREIQENLELLKGQHTIIIVAHRLSTVKHADRIILLQKGRIETVGTFSKLLEGSSQFRHFVELQEISRS